MILLEGATIVTAEKEAVGAVLVEGKYITDVFYCEQRITDSRQQRLSRPVQR